MRRIAILLVVLFAVACGGSDGVVSGDDAAPTETATPAPPTGQPTVDGADDVADATSGSIEAAVADRRLALCGPDTVALPEGFQGYEIVLSDDDVSLVAVICETFAYQATYVYTGWNGAELFPMQVQQWVGSGIVDDPYLLGWPFVRPDGRVANFSKSNGAGSCGDYMAWDFADALILAEARSRSCDDERDYVEPDQWDLVYSRDGSGDFDTAGQDLESFLLAFAGAWGSQDRAAAADLAEPAAIETALATGVGEVSVLWSQEQCGVMSPGEGSCESLFLPEGQTECCAQIWNIHYRSDENRGLIVTELVFGGDAG